MHHGPRLKSRGAGAAFNQNWVLICFIIVKIITTTTSTSFVVTFIQGVYNYVPETNHVSRVHIQCCRCSVFTVCATCNVIYHVKYVLYLHISTSRSMCAVPNMVLFSVAPQLRDFPVCCSGTVWMTLRCFQSPILLPVFIFYLQLHTWNKPRF